MRNKKKLKPAIIGIFVIFSCMMFMVAIILFGGTRYFEKENIVITYFDGSLKGLSVGAPVTYMGVTIGQVKAVNIRIEEATTQGQKIRIPILITLNPNQSIIIGETYTTNKDDIYTFIKSMCEQGLRAKLKLHSMVTGKKYIDLAFHKNSKPIYRDTEGKYLEIPTLPSEMHQLNKIMDDMDLEKLYRKLMTTFDSIESLSGGLAKSLSHENTQQFLDNYTAVAKSLNTLIESTHSDLQEILKKAGNDLDHIKELTLHTNVLIASLDTEIQPVGAGINKTLANLNTSLQRMNSLMEQAEKTIHPGSPLYYRLDDTLSHVKDSAKAIKKLSEYIIRNPDALLFGLPPAGEQHEQ